MKIKVKNNEAFQVNAESFSSNLPPITGGHYTLEISVNGSDFVSHSTEIPGGNLVVAGVVPGMFFRLTGLGTNEVDIIW